MSSRGAEGVERPFPRREGRERRGLYAHAIVFVIVNGMLFILDQLTPGGPWFHWPLIIWGIGLVMNAVFVVMDLSPGGSSENRAIRRYLDSHR